MSVNAIGSVSLYEYYYKINKDEQEKKESPLARQMKEYGLTPTDNEALNVALLQRAQRLKAAQEQEEKEIPYSERPWADIMYQLNIQFNPNPKDDIQDIKDELALLLKDVDDEELNKEIKDLESHVESLYISFQQNYSKGYDNSISISNQLNNLSILNQASLL